MRIALSLGCICVALAGCVRFEDVELQVPFDASTPDVRVDAGASCTTAADCVLPAVATALCLDGVCLVDACDDGFIDRDGDGENGCEHACAVSGATDRCDGFDDDCDGLTDEDGDDTLDACGRCDAPCPAGDGAELACVDRQCTIAGCDAGRFTLSADPAAGCACTADSLIATEIPFAISPRPASVRMAYPGDGRPGDALWTTSLDGENVVMGWAIDVAGYPLAARRVVGRLEQPADLLDAWYGEDGLTVTLSAPSGDRFDVIAITEGDTETIAEGCRPTTCQRVRLPGGAGVVRLRSDGNSHRIVGPAGSDVLRWDVAMESPEPAPSLHAAACTDAERCIVAYRRNNRLRLGGAAGDVDLNGIDTIDIAAQGDRFIAAMLRNDALQVASVTDLIVTRDMPGDGYSEPRIFAAPDGGVWLVARQGAPVAARFGRELEPMGDPRAISGGLMPDVLADDGIFVEGTTAATVERRLWHELPDGEINRDRPLAVLGDDIVYHGRGGFYAASWNGPMPAPRLLVRTLDQPDAPPAAARIGDTLAVLARDAGALVLAAANPVGEVSRTLIDIALPADVGGADLRPNFSYTMATRSDGSPLIAISGQLTDGRPVIGVGHPDSGIGLRTTRGVLEADPRLLVTDNGVWISTRANPGVGVEMRLRRVDDLIVGPATELARRTPWPAVVTEHDGRLRVAWLDRRRDACEDRATDALLAELDANLFVGPAERLPIPSDACPTGIGFDALAMTGAHVLISEAPNRLRVLTLDHQGRAIGTGLTFEGRAADGDTVLGGHPDRPAAFWPYQGGIYRLPLTCAP